MRGRRVLWALGTLAVMALASWLPVAAAEHPGEAVVQDLARPSLPIPQVIPARPGTPVLTVSAFFWQLAQALGNEPAGIPAAATPGKGDKRPPTEPAPDTAAAGFARAYALLSPGWSATLTFAKFTAAWSRLRRLDLLAAVAAGAPAGSPNAVRVFVEIRTLTAATANCPESCLGFADGFYVVTPSPSGWQLASGRMDAENLAVRPAPPTEQALTAARAYAAARPQPPAPDARHSVQLGEVRDHLLAARVTLGSNQYSVQLFQLVDGAWVTLMVQQ